MSIATDFVKSDFLKYVNTVHVRCSDYGMRQYDNTKLGMVQHIPVTSSLTDLTRYFTSPGAKGATHFGTGRELAGYFNGIPVAQAHQYLPTVGTLSPWAQGVEEYIDNPSCAIKVPQHLKDLGENAANCAFLSVENCDRGADETQPHVTDPQFNTNVLLRAWGAEYFKYPINPETQLWHAEFDPTNKCWDPGWPPELEREMQEAAKSLLINDVSLLKGIRSNEWSDKDLIKGQVQKIQRDLKKIQEVDLEEVVKALDELE